MEDEKDQHVTAAPVTSESVDLAEDPKVWRMPEPVFRKSTGYLPKGFQNRSVGDGGGAEAVSASSVGNGTGPVEAAAPAVAAAPIAGEIQPQPDILEDPPSTEATAAPANAKAERSRGMKIFLAVLGIVAMVVFAVVFVAVIYYLFFYHPGENTQF